jgi:Gpi18-like mannosyltransferase
VEPLARKKILLIGTASAASLGLYLWLACRYPLGPSLANPRASWASQVESNWMNAAQHLLIYLGLTLAYLAALRLLAPAQGGHNTLQRYQIPLIIITWLACSAALMFASPAGESHDIFDYLFRGRMMTEYQANPLVDVPETFGLSIPYTRYLAWRKNVDTYGPIWEAASYSTASGVRLVANSLDWWDDSYPVCPKSPESCRLLMLYVAGYRLLSISLTGLSGWLITSLVRHNHPNLAPMALAAWLWSPLTLIATALGGHNDTVMLVLTLLGWWLLQRQRPFWAILALILAAHVKLTALIWLPACALWIVWRYGWKPALKIGLASAISGLALSWLLYAPFGGWQTLPRMLQERSAYLANSIWEIVNYLLIEWGGWSSGRAFQLSIRLPNWLFGIGALLITLWMFNFRPKRWRSPPLTSHEADQSLWRTLAVTSMLYLLIGSFWFQHWYVLWLLAPAVLLPKSLLTRSMLPWLAFGALSSNMIMSFFLTNKYSTIGTTPPFSTDLLAVGLIWGPILFAFVIFLLSNRWRKCRTPIQTE